MRNSSLILWLRPTQPHVRASNRGTCSGVVQRRKMHRAITIYPQFVLMSPPTLTNTRIQVILLERVLISPFSVPLLQRTSC